MCFRYAILNFQFHFKKTFTGKMIERVRVFWNINNTVTPINSYPNKSNQDFA